jgi:hypothetical protein
MIELDNRLLCIHVSSTSLRHPWRSDVLCMWGETAKNIRLDDWDELDQIMTLPPNFPDHPARSSSASRAPYQPSASPPQPV